MGVVELAGKLGISKGLASRLVARGCPVGSVEAAQAWRQANAKPRVWKGKPAPAPRLLSSPTTTATDSTTPPPEDGENTPRMSLERARSAEAAAYRNLEQIQSAPGSPEDLRKASGTYVQARTNRFRAEADFRDWQRAENITMFHEEAVELTNKVHLAAKQMLENGAKQLAPRLVGMPAKVIEKTLSDWLDNLAAIMQSSL